MKILFIFFSALISTLPLSLLGLNFYVKHLKFIQPPEIIQIIFYSIFIIICGLILTFFYHLILNKKKIKFLDSLFFYSISIYIIFIYHDLTIIFDYINQTYEKHFSLLLIIFSIPILFILIKKFPKINYYLKIFFSLYAFYLIIFVLFHHLKIQDTVEIKNNNNEIYFFDSINNLKESSNIYYISLDEMISVKEFSNYYNYDLKEEISNIENKYNAQYIEDTLSSYNITHLTLGSFFNLDYQINENSPAYSNRSNFFPSNLYYENNTNRSNLIRLLNKIGYNFKWIGNQWADCNFYNTLKYCMEYSFLMNYSNFINEYTFNSFFSSSPLIDLLGKFYYNNKAKIENLFINNKNYDCMDHDAICNFLHYSKQMNKKHNKTFFFIHHLNPHSPHTFDQNCNIKKEKHNNKFDYFDSYLCTLKKVEELLNYLSHFDPNAKIIIQGDHGTRFNSQKNEYDINRLKIFNLLVNIDNHHFKNKIDNVNAVRLLISEATKSKINLLDKKSYFGFYEDSNNYGKVLRIAD